MRISYLASTFAVLAGHVHAQGWGGWPQGGLPHEACLNDTGASYLINGYTYLLEHPGGPDFNSTAMAILSDKFVVSSDSINFLSNRTFGSPAYPSKEAFIASQFVTPAMPVVATQGSFHNCDSVSWRWNASGIGSDKYEVQGIINFDVNATALQIDAVYSEFNTGAFAADLGKS